MRTKEDHVRSLRALRQQSGSESRFIEAVAASFVLQEEGANENRRLLHGFIAFDIQLRRNLKATAEGIVDSIGTYSAAMRPSLVDAVMVHLRRLIQAEDPPEKPLDELYDEAKALGWRGERPVSATDAQLGLISLGEPQPCVLGTELKLYIDGGCIGKNPSTVGVYWSVGREHPGGRIELLTARAEDRTRFTNNDAEYLALLDALEKATAITGAEGIRQVRIHCDSELIVNQFNGRYKIGEPRLKLLCQTARSAAEFLHQSGIEVELVWVPRAENVRRLGH